MVQVTEGTFQIGDVSLYTKTWMPSDGPPKAKMIMIHGFSDHVDRYYDFFPSLARRGIAVYGFDQRGWGRSVRKPADRGDTGPTATVLADIAAFVRDKLPDDGTPTPLFVLGHSMGGGEALALASDPQYADLIARVRGWVLEAPFLGFAPELQPYRLTIASGRLAARFLPRFQLYRPIRPEDVCRDPAVQASIRADALMHMYGTLEGLAGLLDRTDKLASGEMRLGAGVRSLFLAHGTADRATSFQKTKAWYDRQTLEDGRFKAYEGFYHQLHADPGKEEFYQDVGDWILARCDGERGAPGPKL
ncbi:Alpha/Beta hydrolase protein [Xylariaceae sp. FL0662B]|nr:Alpha/Beta hydrolase protein [Xylariaceae sp. FL0662B]